MALTFTLAKLHHQKTSMYSLLHQKDLVTLFVVRMKMVLEYLLFMVSNKITQEMQKILLLPTLKESVLVARDFLKQPSKKKQKQIYSENKPFFLEERLA